VNNFIKRNIFLKNHYYLLGIFISFNPKNGHPKKEKSYEIQEEG